MMKTTHGKDFNQHGPTAVASEGSALFEILRQDHETLRDIFKRIEQSNNGQIAVRQELFAKLERQFLDHMEAEERFFYTALEQHDESRPKVLESFEQHQVARIVIGTFTSLAVDDERWPAKLKTLGKLFRQHADEEEHELFALAKKVLSPDQLQGITGKVRELRHDRKNPARS